LPDLLQDLLFTGSYPRIYDKRILAGEWYANYALRMLPSNRLKALEGSRKGQFSIRINDQWRICFEWGDAGPENVEIVDYH
jgi:plasmid maintenance system killer protein